MMFGFPNVVVAFLRAKAVEDRGDPEVYHREEFNNVWSAFYDVAWELCRRGIFRLGMRHAEGVSITWGTLGDGYSLTTQGCAWLNEADEKYVASDPIRYGEALTRPARVLGAAFLQRAAEAAKCHQFGNYLACCAMCGSAAEYTLLAIALAKTDDEELVLKLYRQAGGRQKLIAQIFGSTSGELRRRFEIGFELLTLWRDDAARGRLSEIGQVEAYSALGQLMNLAMLAWDRWTELTGQVDAACGAFNQVKKPQPYEYISVVKRRSFGSSDDRDDDALSRITLGSGRWRGVRGTW